MKYKIVCPVCGKRVSRWRVFLDPTIFHRCRDCGLRFRTRWTETLLVVATLFAWFILEKTRIISPLVAIGLVSLTGALAIWLLPYFTRVIPERRATPDASGEDKGNPQGPAGGSQPSRSETNPAPPPPRD